MEPAAFLTPRRRQALLWGGAVVALLLVTQFAMPGQGGRGTPAAILFKGAILGLAYAVFATGIVLVYRTMRVINFAQGAIGASGAALGFGLIRFTPVPFPIAVVLALAFTAVIGGIVGTFMLRFSGSSRLYLTVVTIVTSFVLIYYVTSLVSRAPFFPSPDEMTTAEGLLSPDELRRLYPFAGLTFQVGSFPLKFGFSEIFALELAVIALATVALFLRYTRSGVAMRALAENPERASLLGIGVGGLTILAWTIAGLLDGVAVITSQLAAPEVGVGWMALLPLFAAALIGGFERLPSTWAAGVGLGILAMAWGYSFNNSMNLFNLVLFAIISVTLLVRRRRSGRSETAEVSWAATNEPRPVPKELAGIGAVRAARWATYVVGLALVTVAPFVLPTNRVFLLSIVFLNAIAVLSLVVLTGWAGQISLGQYAFVAIGAVVGGALSATVGISFWLAVPLASAITAAIAVLVGIPALRMKGLFLLVSTFAFAVAVASTLFDDRYFGWLLPDRGIDRPTLFFLDFEEERSMYFLSVAALVLAMVVVRNLRRGRVGRVLIALRENEPNVNTFGVSALRAKLLAFAVSGALAGFAGAMLAHQQRGLTATTYLADKSVETFLQAVIGGVSSVGGPLLGSAYFTLTSEFIGSNPILQAFFQGLGPLLIVFLAPGGFISLVNQARDSVLRIVAQRNRIVVPSLFADYDPEALERQLIPLAPADPQNGLSAMPPERRYALESELYEGRGIRIVDRLAPARQSQDTLAIGAAARLAEEAEFEAREPVEVEAR